MDFSRYRARYSVFDAKGEFVEPIVRCFEASDDRAATGTAVNLGLRARGDMDKGSKIFLNCVENRRTGAYAFYDFRGPESRGERVA